MKISKVALAIFYCIIHAAFFIHLYAESGYEQYLLGILLLPFYTSLPFETEKLNFKATLLNVIMFAVGFYSTQLFQLYFSPVLSACIVPFIFIVFEFITKIKVKKIEAVLYTGCFAGMISFDWLEHQYYLSILSCIIGGYTFTLLNKSLAGLGGKLGTIAFSSLILWIFIK